MNEKYKEIKDLFRVQITTNGILLDEVTARFLVENNIAISISIDGDREAHNLNRLSKSGTDVYDIIIKNMLHMLKNNMDFAVRMTVTANNVHFLYKNIIYFYNMGIKKINIGIDECGIWNEEAIVEFGNQMDRVDEFYLNNIANVNDAVLNIHDYKLSTFVFKRVPTYCSAGSVNHLVINSKGDIYPCGYVANAELWNIGNVKASLDRKKFIQTARHNVKKYSSCKDCNIAFTCCGAKCGFLNYEKTGFLNMHHETTCKLQRILYTHNFSIIKSLYQQYNERLLKYIELALKNKIPLSEHILQIISLVEKDRKVI